MVGRQDILINQIHALRLMKTHLVTLSFQQQVEVLSWIKGPTSQEDHTALESYGPW